MVKPLILLLALLTGCATLDEQAAKCEAGGGCLKLLKTQLMQAMQKSVE